MRTHGGDDLALLAAVIDVYAPSDQAPRLKQLRQDHPEVKIVNRAPWEATVSEADGVRIIVRWELRELLDRLDELFSVMQGNASVIG